jgi:hypothetical protein
MSFLWQGFPFPAACQAEEVTLLFRHWQLPVQTQVRGCAGGASYPEGSSEIRAYWRRLTVEVSDFFATQEH